jgi:hypothetical protein
MSVHRNLHSGLARPMVVVVVVAATESARRVRDLGALFVVSARGRLGAGCRAPRGELMRDHGT